VCGQLDQLAGRTNSPFLSSFTVKKERKKVRICLIYLSEFIIIIVAP
jgi:hypothetical protein